jgi:hypothetical protein
LVFSRRHSDCCRVTTCTSSVSHDPIEEMAAHNMKEPLPPRTRPLLASCIYTVVSAACLHADSHA